MGVVVPGTALRIDWHAFGHFVHGLLTRNALVTLARDYVLGKRAARVALRGIAKLFSVDLAPAVTTTRAGGAYRLSGYVRAGAVGQTMCLRVQETAGRRLVQSTETCFTPTSRWQKFSVRGRSVAAGHRLLVSAYEFGAERGDSFEVGGVSMSSR